MLLYTARVNDERTARGVLPVNSFWLSGCGVPAGADADGRRPAASTDACATPALRDDGAAWAAGLAARSTPAPVAELLAALHAAPTVTLTLCGERGAQRFGVAAARPGGAGPRALFQRASAAGRAGGAVMTIVARDVPPRSAWALEQAGVHPLLARLFAARGVRGQRRARRRPGAPAAARRPARRARGRACCWPTRSRDGTAHLHRRRLRLRRRHRLRRGAARPAPARRASTCSYVVPDRVVDGYGLTPPIVERVARQRRRRADHGRQRHRQRRRRGRTRRRCGLAVLVTDHHLPGPALPDGRRDREPEPAGLRLREQEHRRRRRDVLRAAGAARRAARARRVRRARRSRGSTRCSTWSRSAPWPTW